MPKRTCPECGAEMIGPMTVETPGAGSAGEVHLKVTPTSGVVRQPTRAQLRGLVCTECGFVELRADPRDIADRWRAGER
jgi:predicted RNA-binding Zn-ribbon protein involved in translation (DUF1610 family)